MKAGVKTCLFFIKDDEVWEKYDKSWDSIKDKLGIKFHSEPVYEYKYLKAKVREFDGVIKTNFLGNDVPKENHYSCITCITIDSVMRLDKKNHPQVYLEEFKYRVKKIQTSRFIDTEIKSDSDSDSDSSDLDSEKMGAKVDNKLMTKLESASDSNLLLFMPIFLRRQFIVNLCFKHTFC